MENQKKNKILISWALVGEAAGHLCQNCPPVNGFNSADVLKKRLYSFGHGPRGKRFYGLKVRDLVLGSKKVVYAQFFAPKTQGGEKGGGGGCGEKKKKKKKKKRGGGGTGGTGGAQFPISWAQVLFLFRTKRRPRGGDAKGCFAAGPIMENPPTRGSKKTSQVGYWGGRFLKGVRGRQDGDGHKNFFFFFYDF